MALSSSSSSSCYPYLPTVNPASIVSIKLFANNYSRWETQMICLLESQDLVGFIDGTISKPPETISDVESSSNGNSTGEAATMTNKDYMMWKRSDRLVKGWILGSLSEDVLDTVFGLSTAKDVWEKLRASCFQENKEEKIEEKLPTQHGVEYPYPSTFNVTNFVTIKLSTDNYKSWVLQILSLVDSLELRDFLMKEPPSQDNYLLWRRTDMLLRGWILGSISENVITEVFNPDYFSSSRSIMLEIEKIFVPGINKRFLSPKPVTTNKENKEEGEEEEKDISVIEYPYPSTFNVANVVTIKLTKANYELWVRQIWSLVDILQLRDFLEKEPPYTRFKALWKRTDMLLRGWILATLSEDVLKIVIESLFFNTKYDTSRSVMIKIEETLVEDINERSISPKPVTMSEKDLALDFVKRYRHAAKWMNHLNMMAQMPFCFRSGMRLNFVESFIYSCVPVHVHHCSHFLGGNGNGDVENPANNSQTFFHHWVHFIGVLCNKLKLMLWDAILLVPSIKIIRQKKLVHHQAVQLVKWLLEAVKSSNDDASFHSRSSEALTDAARFGTLEVVEEILRIFPHTIWSCDRSKHSIIEIAIINRSEKVFNITCQMNELQEYLKLHIDDNNNNILHLAGGMAPRDKLNLVSGAALQMQRELQWFKEVEKLSNPHYVIKENSSNETPRMVFTREHKELVIEGEKWMKDTANSCSIAAALIITIVFAAAITVPGGNKEYNGLPVFYNDPAFLIFAVSDTVALFMSTTSLLMFLSILTARYAEEDFLHTLPKRLVFGLLTLFLSITSMVIAFSSAVYLVFGGRNGWVIIPLAALSCLPVTSFVRLQFPLLIDVYSSTYGRGIFGEQSDRPFHRHIKGFLQYIVKCFASS